MNGIIQSLSYFTTREWIFNSQNHIALFESLNATDAKIFNFDISARGIDWEVYWVCFCAGLGKFLLKELDDEDREYYISKL